MSEIQKQISKIQLSAQTDPRFKQSAEVEVTPEAKEYTNRVFKSLLPHFPAWRQSCPEPDDLGRLKNAWTKAIMRHELKTGKKLNVKAGLLACEESETDWLPSVGKFIKWCEQDDNLGQFAERAYNLFIKRESQIDTVGKMVTANHAFDLRKLEASKCKSGFVEYYLNYAQDNAIEPLEAFAITDGVKLSPEQEEAAQKRTATAQADFLAKFVGTADKMIEEEFKDVKPVKTGVTIGKTKSTYKTPKQLEDEKERQLAAIASKLKG